MFFHRLRPFSREKSRYSTPRSFPVTPVRKRLLQLEPLETRQLLSLSPAAVGLHAYSPSNQLSVGSWTTVDSLTVSVDATRSGLYDLHFQADAAGTGGLCFHPLS